MQKFKVFVSWLDQHLLEVLAYFLIAFIPLYPKLPLFDIIPGYIVRVRLEDLVIAVTGIVWLVQLLRGKITWKTPLTWAIGAYAIVGILSTISAVLITHTVPEEFLHIGKTMLHYFRYLEYFFLFFVVVTSIRNKQQFKVFFFIMLATLLALFIYGYGQRFYYWPVYSTMNREFSKGQRLYLTEHARVQSTFGGHYDLAAYLVVVLPLVVSSFYVFPSKKARVGLAVIFFGGLWLLTQTSSRSSFLGFLLASYIIIGIFAMYQPTWWKRLRNFALHSAVYSLIILFFVLQFGDDIYERFLQTLKGYPTLNEKYHSYNKQRKELLANVTKYTIGRLISEDQVNKLQNAMSATPPPDGLSTDEATAQVLVSSDERPSTGKPGDVYVNVPDIKLVATTSADGSVTLTQVEQERVYSQTAINQGLSAGIRYDTLWPRAIAGFMKNPLLGSGYATLTKESTEQFTEAESTDNNFLRTLGETGALGFITFYGVVGIALKLAWDTLRRSNIDKYTKIFAVSFIAGAVGLLANAIYIDVFAASKVAFTFWAFAGLVTAGYLYSRNTERTALTTSTVDSTESFASMLATPAKAIKKTIKSKKKNSRKKRAK